MKRSKRKYNKPPKIRMALRKSKAQLANEQLVEVRIIPVSKAKKLLPGLGG